jgi:hypothetical protein
MRLRGLATPVDEDRPGRGSTILVNGDAPENEGAAGIFPVAPSRKSKALSQPSVAARRSYTGARRRRVARSGGGSGGDRGRIPTISARRTDSAVETRTLRSDRRVARVAARGQKDDGSQRGNETRLPAHGASLQLHGSPEYRARAVPCPAHAHHVHTPGGKVPRPPLQRTSSRIRSPGSVPLTPGAPRCARRPRGPARPPPVNGTGRAPGQKGHVPAPSAPAAPAGSPSAGSRARAPA